MADQPRPPPPGNLDPRAANRRGTIRADSHFVLIVFSTIFLLTTAFTGVAGDYHAYVLEWRRVLGGHDPWQSVVWPFNAYGPLFNVMAPAILLWPIANKLLFSLSYILYLIWLTRSLGPDRRTNPPSWLWFGLTMLNPFPWEQIAWFGYFDILVGLACVASVHSLIRRRERLSGVFLSLGILLKFIPVVILPFLAFNGRHVRWRLVGVCAVLVAVGFLASVVIWGASTFTPLADAATRSPDWSIYSVANSAHPLFSLIKGNINIEWLEKPLVLSSALAIFIWYILSRVGLSTAILSTSLVVLLFYRIGYANYQMVPFCLSIYIFMFEWKDDFVHKLAGTIAILYFSIMALSDLDLWEASLQPLFHPNVMVVCAFALGCLLLITLLRFSATPSTNDASGPR